MNDSKFSALEVARIWSLAFLYIYIIHKRAIFRVRKRKLILNDNIIMIFATMGNFLWFPPSFFPCYMFVGGSSIPAQNEGSWWHFEFWWLWRRAASHFEYRKVRKRICRFLVVLFLSSSARLILKRHIFYLRWNFFESLLSQNEKPTAAAASPCANKPPPCKSSKLFRNTVLIRERAGKSWPKSGNSTMIDLSNPYQIASSSGSHDDGRKQFPALICNRSSSIYTH